MKIGCEDKLWTKLASWFSSVGPSGSSATVLSHGWSISSLVTYSKLLDYD